MQLYYAFTNKSLTLVVVFSLHFSILIVFSLKHIAVPLPDPLPIFELLVLMTDELPQLCVGVQESLQQQNERQLKFDIINLNGMPNPQQGKRLTDWLTDCWFCMNSGLKNFTASITFQPIPMNSTDIPLTISKENMKNMQILNGPTVFYSLKSVWMCDVCVFS